MKIGIKYVDGLEEVGLLLWALNDALVNADFKHTGVFGKGNPGKVFELILNDNCFKFSKRDEDLTDCDKRINIVWSSPSDNSHYDKELCIISDVVMDHLTNEYMNQYLDKGNIFLSISTSNVTHKNLIYNPLLGVVLFYYELGLHYINYYQAPKNFKQLLGIYHRHVHIGGAEHNRRNFIYNKIKKELNEDFVAYSRPSDGLVPLIESYRYFGKWIKNHSVAYTDYATSVCNIVYETFDSLNTHVSDNRLVLTEKTTKSIIFCEENIFFIWYGPEQFYKELREYGFWFLNSEFYNDKIDTNQEDIDYIDYLIELQVQVTNNLPNGIPKITAICQSVFDSVTYLKNLKSTLGSDEAVYNTLMKKYEHHLKENVRLFKQLEQNCPVKDRLINAILN